MNKFIRSKVVNYKILFLLVAFCLFLFSYKITEHNNSKKFNSYKLSDNEKESLDFFFRAAFDDEFAYVLFGNKPIAICGFNKINIWENHKIKPLYMIARSIYEAYKPYNQKIKKGWNTWKKRRKYFNSCNFIIKSEPNPSNDDYEYILIINKSLFLKTTDNFYEDFYRILGKTFDAQEMLRQCEKGANLLADLLRGHSALIGILLGYGRENAWNYYEREQLEKLIAQSSNNTEENRQKLADLNSKLMIFSQEDRETLDNFFSSILQNENRIEKYLAALPNLLSLPQFCANPESAETKQLKVIYSQDRKNIIKLYENKDFLKTTLERLQASDY